MRTKTPLDPEWDKLLARLNLEKCLPDDPEVNSAYIDRWHFNSASPKGSHLHPGYHAHPYEPHWCCKIYLGGEQRTIGKGSCYQMAKLYDAARFFFEKYRTAKESFGGLDYNFSKETAERELKENLFLRAYLENIEHELIKREELLTQEQRAEHSALRKKDLRHSRYTTAGQLKYTQDLMLEQIENLSLGVEQLMKQNEEISRRLDELTRNQSVLRLTPERVPFNIPNPAWTTPDKGPGYTVPYIGDEPNQQGPTCKSPDSV